MRHHSPLTTHLLTAATILLSASSLIAADSPPTLTEIRAGMDNCAQRLTHGQTGQATQRQQTKIADMLGALAVAVEKREQQSQQQAAGQGQPGQASASQSGQGREAGQGGQTGGGSRANDQDSPRRAADANPGSSWNALRDRQRKEVENAIQERFPVRYQQLLKQYYKSFEAAPRGAK